MKKTITNWLPDKWRQKTKTWLALTALLACGATTQGQVLITQDFSTGSGSTAPSGWTTAATATTGTPVTWTFSGAHSITGGTPGFAANYAIFDSDAGSATGEDGTLESPAFNASLPGTYRLEYDNQFRSVGGSGGVPTVEVWNGTAWTAVLTYTSSVDDGYSTGNHKLIDITTATGGSAVAKVRFHWVNGSDDWWWAVDNVTITRLNCTAPTATYTIAPNCGSNQFSVNVNITSMGSATSIAVTEGATTYATATAPGTYAAGPFAAGSSHTLTLVHNLSTVCNVTSPAQTYICPPANDNCGSATGLTVNTDLACASVTAGTTVGATASTETAPTCGATGTNDDVWYSFVATGTAHQISLTNIAGNVSDMAMSVYSGSCGSLVPMQCSDPETMVVSGLTGGQTYYIRVWTWSSTATDAASFNICVGTPPPPPANDNCGGAVSLTVNPNYSCGSVMAGTTASATPSSETAPSCGSSGTNDDVWYKFTATATSHRISLTNITGSTDMAMSVYSGSCGSLVAMQCSDPETMNVSGLTVGQTYYVRVWTWSSGTSDVASFNICVGTAPPPPANDNCSGAVALTVNPDYNCGSSANGTTASATQSTETAPTVAPTGTNDDVWYKFTASSTTHRITLTNITGTATDMAMAVYSGACGSLVHMQSSDPETMDVTGLTPGTEYKVRVWTYTSTVGSDASFTICVGTMPPPPVNDEATGAVTLTVGAGCTGNPYDNGGATQSPTENYTSCKGSAGYATMWYKFVAPASGAVKVSNDGGGTLGDSRIALFSVGNPSDSASFSIIACDDDNGVTLGTRSLLYAAGLTPGTTYYVAVDLYASGSTRGTYCVTVDELSSSMLAATAGDCVADQASVGGFNTNYTGWVSLVDANGNLNANVRQTAGAAGSFSSSRTIKTGASRTDATSQPYLNRNFLISGSGATAADLQLFFLNTEVTTLGMPLASLNVSRVSGSTCTASAAGTFTSLPQTANGSVNGVSWIQVSTPGFSNFFINSGTVPLPVDVVFKGSNAGAVNNLDWTTSREVNFSHFELQRSADGKSFSKLATVNSKGAAGGSAYSYTDERPFEGRNYYRLNMVDNDGQSAFSNTIELIARSGTGLSVNVHPNPVKQQLSIDISGKADGKGQIQVLDIVGKVLQTIAVNGSNVSVDMSNLPAGTYMIRYTDSSHNNVTKVTKN